MFLDLSCLLYCDCFLVAATDRDSGANAELTYFVNDDNFYVHTKYDERNQKYIGYVKVAK